MKVAVTLDIVRGVRPEGSKSACGTLVVVGDGARDGIAVQGGEVFPRHAAFFASPDGFYFAALESGRMPQLNGKPVTAPVPVQVGDRISLGKFVLTIKALGRDDGDPPRYAGITMIATCRHCGHPMPVCGPTLRWVCGSCQKATEVPHVLWKGVMNAILDALPRAGDLTFSEDLRVRWTGDQPCCAACATPLPVSQIAVGTAGDVHCPQCGASCTTAPAPNWMRGACLAAKQFYLADLEAGSTAPAVALPTSAAAVMLACPNCGGALKLGAEACRTTPCGYCNVDVYLPDDVWRRLHPVKTARTWFVRFEGQSPEERELEKRVKKLLARVVARPG